MTHRPMFVTLLTTLAMVTIGCGDDGTAQTGNGDAAAKGELVVSAATSLKTALTTYGKGFRGARVRFSFAGSDMLAAQLRQGVRPDVFASANTKLPDELFAAGLVQQPRAFAGNRLVIAVPTDTSKIRSLDDLTKDGVTIAAGSKSVPVGAYTRRVLARLDPTQSKAILGKVRSAEPDVAGIVGKLTQGAVDAGFVYITDVEGTAGRLTAIELPAGLRPQVAYGVAVVKDAPNAVQAEIFVDGLLTGPGQKALQDAGFEPPPPA